ncbi:MAG: hypothetical protein HYR66_13110 [Sphingobacteriales bacterium]|nr:hypothetical protein [Sphingobacteriales bacterium]MBI3719980.1 hypothetical protein [Sphingobacteriales bacterium]
MKKDIGSLLIVLIPGLALAGYIAIRIFTVGITHDEPQTCLTYAQFSIWDIITNRNHDNNNHVFHTLLVKLFSSIFGTHQWSVRIPNFIGFILYYVAAAGLLKKIISNKWFLLASVLFVTTNPFLLDFFGLARGYGLACGIMMVSVFFAVSYIETNTLKHLSLSLFFGVLATYTQFTIINYFASLLIFFGIYFLFIHKQPLSHWLSCIVSVVLLTVLIYKPVKELLIHNEVPNWGQNNFVKDTVDTLVRGLNYNNGVFFISRHQTISWLLSAGVMGGVASLLVYFKNLKEKKYQQLLLSAILLLGSVLMTVLQNKLFNTPYLITRTAIFFFPLTAIFILISLNYVALQKSFFGVLILILGTGSLIHFIRNANTSSAFEWPFNKNESRVICYLRKKHESAKASISLNCHWHFFPALDFYKRTENLDWLELTPFHKEVHKNGATDYYFTYLNEAAAINNCYSPLILFMDDNQAIFKCH